MSRAQKIRAGVQLAVDWAFDEAPCKVAMKALDAVGKSSELSDISPLASAVRLCLFYADFGPPHLDPEDRARRLGDLKAAVKALALIILGRVIPTSQMDGLRAEADAFVASQTRSTGRDVKRLAAGDKDD